MKKIIPVVFVIFTFCLGQLFAQSVEKLDEKNGFKNFKFGSPPDLQNSIQQSGYDKSPNITTYYYSGKDLNVLYNAEIEGVVLTYFKKQLMNILIVFKSPFSEDEYKIVLYSLQQLFGSGDIGTTDDPDYSKSQARIWYGKKVEMELINCYNKSISAWSGYLSIKSKSIARESINDEF